ncbi:MAG: DinB family protein [Gemmatimonadaceae bacterium]|nr:DinB family protein [Gemmatimonadaceae bacterium]
MAGGDTRWRRVLDEQAEVLAAFIAAVRDTDRATLHAVPATGGWSVAQECVHVAMSYDYGAAAVRDGAAMRRRAPRVVAWLSRMVLLPYFLATRTFPRGAPAPGELRPPVVDDTMTADALTARVREAAAEAASALRFAEEQRPDRRVMHAYFGPLRPALALRLLSAHTRHHACNLQQRARRS